MENTPKTLGMEFESVIQTREALMEKLPFSISSDSSPIKTITRDASVESTCYRLNDKSSLFLGNMFIRNHLRRKSGESVMGYEIVTRPLSMDKMRTTIRQILDTQVKNGEIFSARSSIHVHTGFPYGFIFLKTAIALGLAVEPLLFKIAGMGRPYRGETNNSNYARALNLPPAIKLHDSERFAVINPELSLEKGFPEGFWNCFGVGSSERERYVPLRYMAINIYSTLLRGTLEFRFFNFSTISRYVESVASLSQFLAELMIKISVKKARDLRGISIFDKNPDGVYLKLLEELLNLGKYYDCDLMPCKRDIHSIQELIEKTPQPVFKNKPIQSHVNAVRLTEDHARKVGLEIIDKAEDPGIIDIHNFSNSDRTLL